jgi:hypothetical protein
MLLFGVVMFLSAFLLFLVQPLIGKYILPWFGGTPAVWTTCMLFFQAILLGGYGYAHALANRWQPRRQAIVHILLVGVTIFLFPIIPSQSWRPLDEQSPIPRILSLLFVTIGAPYFVLSATAPLLQWWFSHTRPDTSPYRLYSLSNLGSLLAVVSYPLVVEPSLSLSRQASVWSWSYAAFAVMCVLLSVKVIRAREPVAGAPLGTVDNAGVEGPRPDFIVRMLWLGLTACSSVMLLATTNQLCQDVAVVPLLWILPLALYLLSYILCFQYPRIYWRPFFICALAGSIAWTCFALFRGIFLALPLQILSYSLTLFVSCMVCHGELVRLKPDSRYLTSFYLMVAGGGALGGMIVTFVAPQLFRDYWEYHLGLLATALLTLIVLFRDGKGPLYRGRPIEAWGALYIAVAALAVVLAIHIGRSTADAVETTRNFFGVLRVMDERRDNPGEQRLVLLHGRIQHGFQYLDPKMSPLPTSYYGPDSGVGLAIRFHPRRLADNSPQGNLRIGVIGLGVGTLAGYGKSGDYVRFYEINPEVIRLSEKYFTYRKNSPAHIDVVHGDARISMEMEQQRRQPQQFDVLAVDAFNSDAIPVHLLTRECFQTYLYHMKNDGILALHISNRYFDLKPVVRGLASLDPDHGLQALWIDADKDESRGIAATTWILLTANQMFLANPEIRKCVSPWDDSVSRMLPWTDDYSNLFSLLRR